LEEWGEERAEASMPQYAKDIVQQYLDDSETFQNLKEFIVLKKKS